MVDDPVVMPIIPPVALVTGNRRASASMAALLRRRTYRVQTPSDSGCVPDVKDVNCYVQLPWSLEPGVHRQPRECLSSRLDLLAAIVPCLGERATVLLGVDDGGVPADLLQALAVVLLEDLGRGDTRVVAASAADLCGDTPSARSALLGIGA